MNKIDDSAFLIQYIEKQRLGCTDDKFYLIGINLMENISRYNNDTKDSVLTYQAAVFIIITYILHITAQHIDTFQIDNTIKFNSVKRNELCSELFNESSDIAKNVLDSLMKS